MGSHLSKRSPNILQSMNLTCWKEDLNVEARLKITANKLAINKLGAGKLYVGKITLFENTGLIFPIFERNKCEINI
jgi:hypothetical protein